MFRRILVPLDGSETANRALAAAIALALESGGKLRLVHVVEELAYLAGYDPLGGSSGRLFQSLRENGDTILKLGVATARAAGAEADTVLFDTFDEHLAETVARSATQWDADLIVVGTHGRRGVSRLLLGSGAEQIVRLAPVAVLVVRAGAASRKGVAPATASHTS